MDSKFDRNDMSRLADSAYTSSLVTREGKRLTPEDKPANLLALFVAACINDLFSSDSSNRANGERIALALEHGSQSLSQIARILRRKTEM